MKKIVILGAGTAGTTMLNKLYNKLHESCQFTIIDKSDVHYYQPGFLFVPFGIYKPEEVVKPKKNFIPNDAEFVIGEVEKVLQDKQEVVLFDGKNIPYDILIVATGTDIAPEETPGLKDKLWQKDIFDFYTYEGAVALADKLKSWQGGKLVINLAESIIKCPVAPLEFSFLADSFFKEKGIRDKVEISYVTPLPGAFTKPKATAMLGKIMDRKDISVIPDFYLEQVNNETKELVSYDGKTVPFDLLVSIPVNMGSKWVEESNMGDTDDLNYIPTNKNTLQSNQYDNIFVIGDATNLPTSKAGAVAHFEAEILEQNILSYLKGEALDASFDGHANCFIETGNGKAALIDFNYKTEPLPGSFPIPGVGPFKLLKETRINHYGKLMFKWAYWHKIITGKYLPVSAHMSMAGKIEN